jgi:hypothetical protein
MKKIKVGDKVTIIWRDTCGPREAGWRQIKKMEPLTGLLVRSTGWVVSENKYGVRLAADLAPKKNADTMDRNIDIMRDSIKRVTIDKRDDW